MARIYLKRTLSGFAPADQPSLETMRKYKVGDTFKAEVTKPRSYKEHCLCMALLSLTYEHLPERYERQWPTFTAFRHAIAEAAGHMEEYTTIEGEVRRHAKSLSYDSIPDNVEFGRVMADMMTICARILDIDQPELAAEVSRYASEQYGVAA